MSDLILTLFDMPHIVLKLWKGRSEEQEEALAKAFAKAAHEITGLPAEEISVGIEDYPREKWMQDVYYPQIINGPGTLYVKPGYDSI